MEIIKNLITRLRRMGFLLLIGFLLIIYIAFGFVYLQQPLQQRELEEKSAKLSLIVAKPLRGAEELQAEYDEANRALAPVTVKAALDIIVGIAEKSGIDTDPDAGKLHIPSATFSETKVGESNYQVLPFRNIQVQGDHDSVMAFLADLDLGKTLKTMVLKRVATIRVEVPFTGEEGDRRAEFRTVISAVIDMMEANALSEIPNPMNYSGGVALMGDDPDTEGMVEGFPDIITTAAEKGYTGTGAPRDGYVLYNHDKISTDDTTQFETVSYITMLATEYYYTCEADGTVRQFDGADVVTAMEYLGSEESKTETVATLDVDIYIKPEE